MHTKLLSVNVEESLLNDVEKTLDDIGLDVPTAVRMFFKRLIKEGNVSFLVSDAFAPRMQNIAEKASESFERTHDAEEKTDRPSSFSWDGEVYPMRRSNNSITPEMREYVWNAFKAYRQKGYAINHQSLAKAVSDKTGMNKGSAFIYILMLDNWFEAKPNTRIMKFEDLVFFVNSIKKESDSSAFAATIKSLEDSIPYWEERIAGRFAEKVEHFIKQFK